MAVDCVVSQLSYCSHELFSFSIFGSQEGLTLFIRRVDNFWIIFVLVTSRPLDAGFAVWHRQVVRRVDSWFENRRRNGLVEERGHTATA